MNLAMDDTEHVTGCWIIGIGGRPIFFDDENFHRNVYDLREMAHALSMLCRFNGHMTRPYSVAQHSVFCSDNVDTVGLNADDRRLVRSYALVHDCSEAFVGDLVRPIKCIPEMAFFKVLEERFEKAIHESLGLPEMPEWAEERVKHVDNRALMTERRDLLSPKAARHHWSSLEGFAPFAEKLYGLDPRNAADQFLHRANELGLLDNYGKAEFYKNLRHP